MRIATASIKDWSVVDDTGSSVSISDNNLVNIQTATTSGSDRSYLLKRLSSNPGETIKVKFRAKVTSGQSAAIIDYPSGGSQKAVQVIDSQDWQQYEVVYAVHDFAPVTDYFQIAIGQPTGYSGEVDISEITVEVENSRLPVARCYCAGLLIINESGAGSVKVNKSFSLIGLDIEHAESQTASTTLSLKLPFVYGSSPAQSAPIFYADFTPDQPNTHKVICKIGSYSRETGDVTVKFIDATTGALIDVSTLGLTYLWITGFGM